MAPPEFNRDKVIGAFYSSEEVTAAIKTVAPDHLQEDLRQEIFIVLCKMPEEKLRGLHERKELRWYTVRIMLNMINSDRSTFYNTHRKYSEEILITNASINNDGRVEYDNRDPDLFDASTDGATPDQSLKQPASLVYEETDHESIWTNRVETALGHLEPYEADMFRLYTEMGLTCTPVARATKIPVRAVRFVVAQARQKLQTHLRQ